jgi:hypothetical protein
MSDDLPEHGCSGIGIHARHIEGLITSRWWVVGNPEIIINQCTKGAGAGNMQSVDKISFCLLW